jgi:hypothetical protein
MVKLGLANTPRKLALLYRAPVFNYSLRLPILGLVVLLGLIFATIAPIMLIPVVFLFFVLNYILKINFESVYCKKQVDSGGQFYAKALGHFWASIVFSQLVVLAIFVLKESWIQAGLIGIVWIATLLSGHWIRCKADHELLTTDTTPIEADAESFIHPCLKEQGGVWIEGLEEQEKVVVEAGLMLDTLPRVLDVGGGKKPDVLNVCYGETDGVEV